MKTCQESTVPIVITRNGYGEAVIMSIALFEKLFAKVQAAALINESLDEIDGGAKGMDADEFFNRMAKKYGK